MKVAAIRVSLMFEENMERCDENFTLTNCVLSISYFAATLAFYMLGQRKI